MAKHKFEIVSDSDEAETVKLNGKDIISTNHDEDGWQGMKRVRDAVEAIAKEIGATVERR